MSIKDVILDWAPWYLRNRVGGRILLSAGLTLDTAIETTVQGLHASNPLKCEVDALDQIAVQRRMRLFASEPIPSKRKRLSLWRQAWKLAGSHRGEMMQLQPYFLPNVPPRIRIVHQSGDGQIATWHTMNPDGSYEVTQKRPSNWDWDGMASQWSRFWVIIYVDSLPIDPPIHYDEGYDYDEGWLWDGGLTAAQVADIVAIINHWKAAHSILWGVIFARDPDSFDPTSTAVTLPSGETTLPVGNWGYYIDNDTGLPSRLSTASYAFDLGQG